jgi:hypothetical protein
MTMYAPSQCLAVSLGCLILACVPVLGQEPIKTTQRKVVTTAVVTTRVKPNGATLTFAVNIKETGDKSAWESQEKMAKKVRDTIATLSLGKVDVQIHWMPNSFGALISNQAAGALISNQAAGARAVVGKQAQCAFQITVKEENLDTLRQTVAKIAEAASDLGGIVIESNSPIRIIRPLQFNNAEPEAVPGSTIEWTASNTDDARRDVIKRAVKRAMADAQAAVGDAKLVALEIDVNNPDEPLFRAPIRGESNAAENMSVLIRVAVRVTCTY